jgi:hypothetical protein
MSGCGAKVVQDMSSALLTAIFFGASLGACARQATDSVTVSKRLTPPSPSSDASTLAAPMDVGSSSAAHAVDSDAAVGVEHTADGDAAVGTSMTAAEDAAVAAELYDYEDFRYNVCEGQPCTRAEFRSRLVIEPQLLCERPRVVGWFLHSSEMFVQSYYAAFYVRRPAGPRLQSLAPVRDMSAIPRRSKNGCKIVVLTQRQSVDTFVEYYLEWNGQKYVQTKVKTSVGDK